MRVKLSLAFSAEFRNMEEAAGLLENFRNSLRQGYMVTPPQMPQGVELLQYGCQSLESVVKVPVASE